MNTQQQAFSVLPAKQNVGIVHGAGYWAVGWVGMGSVGALIIATAPSGWDGLNQEVTGLAIVAASLLTIPISGTAAGVGEVRSSRKRA